MARTNGAASTAKRTGVFGADAGALMSAVDGALGEGEKTLRRWMQTKPTFALALAAGAGYLLGGGLTPRLATRLISTGGRILVAAAVERWLAEQIKAGTDLVSEG